MPVTPFQREVLRLLAVNRSPESHVAGAIVLNQEPDSPRYSKDIHVNHDVEEAVVRSSDRDAAVLSAHGYGVEWGIRQPMFVRAMIRRGEDFVKLEWVFDSAYRLFPAEPDPDCGWRLNFYDAATNKVLALVGRVMARDFVDIIQLHRHRLSFGALCWAASAKDAGLNPFFILGEARRTTHYPKNDFEAVELVQPLDLPGLYQTWRQALADADVLLGKLPAEEIGCLYLNEQNLPVTPDPALPEFSKLRRHFGSVRGAWPVIRE